MRPTSRQRMQRLADELAAEGLVKFIANPKHQRSQLVQLTRKGDARYRDLNARFLVLAGRMSTAVSEAEIRKTTSTVRQLSEDVKALYSRP
jgi:DNA-binding MarR family transcriptional regulator